MSQSEAKDAFVDVIVTKGGVQFRIREYGDSEHTTKMTLSPETARTMAQRLTLASFRYEEIYGEIES